MHNVSLTEMIEISGQAAEDQLHSRSARERHGHLYTYGEVKPVDLMPLLRDHSAHQRRAMVKVGDLYRIVPIEPVRSFRSSPMMNADPKTLPDDERMILNLIFLKYATAAEMDKLIKPFLGEGASAHACTSRPIC